MPCSPTETIQIFKELLAVCFPLSAGTHRLQGMAMGLKKQDMPPIQKYPATTYWPDRKIQPAGNTMIGFKYK